MPDRAVLPLHTQHARPASVSLQIDPAAFTSLIRAIVGEVLAQLEVDRRSLPDGPLAYSEDEAARLLALEPHQLRDERRRGRIAASSIVGRRIRYTRADLLEYLSSRRVGVDRE